MPSLKEFLERNASALTESLRRKMPPLHDYDDPVDDRLGELLRKCRGLQSHVITASIKSLRKNRSIFFGLAMGTGKTFCSLATAHLLANGKPYSCLIIALPHLVLKWQREIEETIPDPTIYHVNGWQEWLELARNKPAITGPTFFISPLSTAKLGAKWVPASPLNRRLGELTCPQCFKPLYYTWHGVRKPVTKFMLTKSQRKCIECGSTLWQYIRPHKIEPSVLIKRRLKRYFDVAILDEQHVMKGATTKAGESFSHFVGAAKKVLVLTGTMIAGRAEDLRPTLYRLMPHKFVNRGIKWDDVVKFNERYGRIEYTTDEHEGTVRRHGGTRTAVVKKGGSKKVVPGLMPSFYRDFLVDCTIFCSLKEMMLGGDLPKLEEIMVPVQMSPEMQAEYEVMKLKFAQTLAKLRKEDAWASHRFGGTVAEVLCTWPDDPYGWDTIGYEDKNGTWHEVYRPSEPSGEDTPKEKRLIELILSERAAGRQVWVFSTRTATSKRLLKVMVKHHVSCAHLTVDVPPVKREQWIKDYAVGMDCVLSHPELCATGIDFFGKADGKFGQRFNYCTICHY